MNFRSIIAVLFSGLIFLVCLAIAPGCANVVPPMGGARDSIPPVLLKVTPADSSVNFTGNRINFTFDEYIDIDNFSQNAIISPIPKSTPQPNRKLNTMSLKLRDSLEPNTTYTINFGRSIKDVNEGNPMQDFTYVFSTGPHIDSLTFRGNVVLAESGKVDTTLSILLHRKSEDSALVKDRPRYMAKLDNKGNFVFHNLPPGIFYVYALKDDSRSYRYLNDKVLFAFSDSPVVVRQNTRSVTLYAYVGTKASTTTGSTTGAQNASDKRLKFQPSALAKSNKPQDLLQKFKLQFDRPLRRFDSTKVFFSTDSTYTPVDVYSWSMDTTKKKLTLNTTWQENTVYHLILQKDFAADTMGYQLLKADTITFRTLKNSDYGKLLLRFKNLDLTKNPVLEFVQNDEVQSAFPLTGNTLSMDIFLPGEYELRLLNDTNKNGVWDPGAFYGKHRQPEIVKPIERKIILKAGQDSEVEIIL